MATTVSKILTVGSCLSNCLMSIALVKKRGRKTKLFFLPLFLDFYLLALPTSVISSLFPFTSLF
ncbi:hypothetical protein AZF06_06945 [Priestia endophytica]|uniref:Uncharacterized protein n=1 Tax=Priestia endophytica TaxID=135735 RepID=A0AAX1Q1L6_9BACI|nr:hypothetical protein AZF06_06945 [Priestia endophytica]MBG9811658.1 hypothetical protein [Priestia endophytica]RAS72070.1 hypothetical protein A3864_23625 [Priestia endophytica]RAS74106.1 hypothetical protein A4U60_23200 [Priestia endophytica]RAS89705.1 hypothetical protein A3863_10860 [Priestia endophytica]